MFMGYGEATLNNVKFIDNAAKNGGALALAVLTNVNINNCEFTKNSATADGGAVYVDSQNFNIKNTTFTQNSAKNKGGAVYDSVKTTTIDNSEFLENTARLGGALYYARGTVTATNSKFIRNVATEDAGAVYRNGPFYGDDNVFQENSPNDFEYTGSADGDDINPPSNSGYSGSSTGYRSIDKITVNNHQIPIKDNKLTLGVLNQIFNKDFTNGYLLVYIDGKLVFNATTTDNLLQIIFDLLSLLSGNHEIKVVFTGDDGNTNTYIENITI
jgi:predicted outer membrane repeat protein